MAGKGASHLSTAATVNRHADGLRRQPSNRHTPEGGDV